METLVRPQELLYTKINDLEIEEQYAKINISEHGKEGIKQLLLIDSFPYLMGMLKEHKDRKNNEFYLFLNNYNNQLTPFAINKKLKLACKKLKIDKPITCYSLKRFGVTFKRLSGEDDVSIQRTAGWTTTKQLKTYDLSNQDDIFKRKLAERGLIKDKKYMKNIPQTKPCPYCGDLVGFAESVCNNCKNLLDKELIKKNYQKNERRERAIEILETIWDDDFVKLVQRKKEQYIERIT